jgi:hypothetical protein
MSFHGDWVEQTRCLMRGMDETRNLGPQMALMPAPLADRVGKEAGLPTREALSTYLSNFDLERDFAAYLWLPVSRANDNDPTAPMARYFVIHDTSGPNFGHRSFPEEVDNGNSKINSLNKFRCSDGRGKAHVVINRSGYMLLNHELELRNTLCYARHDQSCPVRRRAAKRFAKQAHAAQRGSAASRLEIRRSSAGQPLRDRVLDAAFLH